MRMDGSLQEEEEPE